MTFANIIICADLTNLSWNGLPSKSFATITAGDANTYPETLPSFMLLQCAVLALWRIPARFSGAENARVHLAGDFLAATTHTQ